MATSSPTAASLVEEADRLAAVRRYAILDTPPDGAFDRVCALAARFFGVPFASVTIVDEERIWFKADQGLDAVEIPRDPGLCASAVLQDEAYVISDALSDPRTADNPLVHGELGVRFYAAAPIVTRDGHRLGTINVIDTKPRLVTEQETQTLQDLAGIVMDELELRLAAIREVRGEQELRRQGLEQQRHAEGLARTLQRSLSPPRLPDIEGLDVAVRYEPYAAEDIGGDFYDHFPLAPGRSCFFLGDVCGKGAPAAAVTSLARYTLRTAALLREGPWATLAHLNAALLMERAEGMQTCTVVYGEIDVTGGSAAVRLAVAGHPAPLIVRAGGSVEITPAHGTILGAFGDPAFHTCAVRLEPGDAIVVYSDGLLDAEHDGVVVDEHHLATLLAGAPDADAQMLVDRLWQTLGGVDRLRDDVAIMALRRTA
ncbi:MAG: phosphoserine phosphatase RsbU/P [Solirubrobacteraceae bacterium]|jgi:sigma-B regulation protein RsbU (phosphoserine phosphatase)|nr:phosphoserine phosphatase RsbU/P [Solirubrobacteraceae bacterium]